jgi:hypothetical protein
MKEETIEEAANRILSKEGIKLHPSGLKTYLKGNVINAMVEMAKWQMERSYSEEDMKEAYVEGVLAKGSCKYGKPFISVEEWFKQFK